MSSAIAPLLSRSRAADDFAERFAEARELRLAEIARQRADREAPSPGRPAPSAAADAARPVETVETSARSEVARPAGLSSEARSMLAADRASTMGPDTGPAQSTRLISALLDALRSYERSPGG